MVRQQKMAIALAHNVQRLMEQQQLSQAELGRKSGVAQRTISTLLDVANPEAINPRARTIEQLAAYFGVPAWQLLVPDLPMDMLRSKQLGVTIDQKVPAGAKAAPGSTPSVDARLLSQCLDTAFSALRAKRRVPTDDTLAAAAAFLYAHVVAGRQMKDVAREVKALLDSVGLEGAEAAFLQS